MEEIINILIGFYNSLGMPFKFARKFFINNKELVDTSYMLNSLEANELIGNCLPIKKAVYSHIMNATGYLVFQRKKVKAGYYGWGVIVLNKNKKYTNNYSVFCEEASFPEKFNYLLTQNFSIRLSFLSKN